MKTSLGCDQNINFLYFTKDKLSSIIPLCCISSQLFGPHVKATNPGALLHANFSYPNDCNSDFFVQNRIIFCIFFYRTVSIFELCLVI